ncbi:unnamed protein product [Cylicostephanus goldi]|uniref:Haloacid dehalogenase-like hydrolase domain-containing protein 3 n=1 Tax=Cylicostephanus goldi TaxID=71465 RepID=A0A3P6RX10_CYLGO|nr:unnamed protein product [Cylicostephanus goldi]
MRGCSTKIGEEKGEKIAHDLFDFYAEGSAWRLTDPKLKSVLKQLRENGVGIVIVSNFDCRLKKILQDMGLYELFDMVVASGEVGVEKPNPDIFELVLQRYHLHDASQMLHIGDNVQKDFQAARQFGASALLFDPLSVNAEVSSADKITSFSELTVQ